MTETGIVLKKYDDMADVSVQRKTACESCHAKDVCISCKNSVVCSAYNEVGAGEGDTVRLETPDSTVLKYSFVVFVIPVLICVILYGILIRFLDDNTNILVTLAVFVVSFIAVALLYNRLESKKKKTVRIVEILTEK